MAIVFNTVLHLLLVGSFGLFLYAVIADALADRRPAERVMRIAAIAAGAMVALGAQVAGVSYAMFTVDALAGARGPSAVAAVVSTVIPALTGVGLGFFLVRTFNTNSRIGARVFGFLAMLAATAFASVYAQATQTKGVFLGVAALPNIAFVVGAILTVVFTWDPESGSSSGLLSELKAMISARRGGQPSPTEPSSTRPSAAFHQPRRDPFAD